MIIPIVLQHFATQQIRDGEVNKIGSDYCFIKMCQDSVNVFQLKIITNYKLLE